MVAYEVERSGADCLKLQSRRGKPQIWKALLQEIIKGLIAFIQVTLFLPTTFIAECMERLVRFLLYCVHMESTARLLQELGGATSANAKGRL